MREACVTRVSLSQTGCLSQRGVFVCVCVRERHDWRVMWGIADSVGRPDL